MKRLWLLVTCAAVACDAPASVSIGVVRGTVGAGPLRRDSMPSRYFKDSTGRVIYLTGSHTWANLVDAGEHRPPRPFSYDAFLDSLEGWNHNFFRLWTWEQSRWSADTRKDFYFAPLPFVRSGMVLALDSQPRFDLRRFDDAYFARLRNRVKTAQDRGFYVAVMLFNGWSTDDKDLGHANPWLGHPFNARNNQNGIDGDLDGNGEGQEVHTLGNASIVAIQEAYVRRVIDAVNDFDNVLYEISNESDYTSTAWQYHMIDVIKRYQATKARRHPVGMTVQWPKGDNATLFASGADWISPKGPLDDPPIATGSKVILDDTDHLCGLCGDGIWVWKSFLRGRNPVFMDVFDGSFIIEPSYAVNDPRWAAIRRNLGYTRSVAGTFDLARMRPRPELASSGFCLADTNGPRPVYLALALDGRVDVTLPPSAGLLETEWLSIETGAVAKDDRIQPGERRTLRSPFRGASIALIRAPELPGFPLR